MTDAEHKRYLRLLRFPKELERAFQHDYFAKLQRWLRLIAVIGAIITARNLVVTLVHPEAFAFPFVVPLVNLVICLGLLVLTFVRGFERYWQAAILCFTVCSYFYAAPTIAATVGAASSSTDPEARVLFYIHLFHWLLIPAILLRLQFRWGVLTTTGISAIWIWAAATRMDWPLDRLLAHFSAKAASFVILVLVASYVLEYLQRSAFLANHLLDRERAKTEAVLQNMLPSSIAERLKEAEAVADDHAEATVLFADIVDFTPWSAQKPAREVLQLLNEVFSRFDRLMEAHGLEKIKTVGDCYMAVAGAPVPRADHVEAAARLAVAMQEEAARISREQGVPIRFRIGIHTGPLVAGVIGEKRYLYDVWGDTVNTASRMETSSVPGAIHVSAEVAGKLGGRFRLQPRGAVEIKGRGMMETYFLEGEAAPARGAEHCSAA